MDVFGWGGVPQFRRGIDGTGARGFSPAMALISLYKNSAVPRLLYRLHQGYMKVRVPVTLGVRTMILDGQGQVLLVRHTYRPGWYFPGGGVKRWETLEEAARREAREEAGVDPAEMEGPIGLFANFMEAQSDHVALFVVRRWRTIPCNSTEIAESRFFPLTDLPADATDATRRRVEEHLGLRPRSELW